MQDQPSAIELVDIVADFIRNHAMPQLQGHAAFHARVAANALDIVKRELQIAPKASADEHERLKKLLGRDGSIAELNRELCARIETGDISLETPGLEDHLWAITMTKLAIDQPNYSGFVRALEEQGLK
ncbi:MAG: DUF6285 domain-containing protein [Parvibaculum sp.]|jgi:hypothetical protein|uniref:DUF6285 domain-containing protein n=1 Tax=Parvibaculum sp. TaxID=2024848 RepID=UPI0028508E1A|nr:DUF6285 domain-containing protein [Parvibaculum sp.]MDR3500086.1 DUF6285 domain-containing protein [Parvibaculum sp.]